MRGASIEATVHVLAMQRLEDRLHDALCPGKNVSIPESQDAVTVRPNERIATLVVVRLLNVLTAIQFNDDRCFEADEIANEGAEGPLPAELEATQSAAAQFIP